MEFQLTDEFVKENELNEKQIEAVKGYVTNDFLPDVKKGWDSLANENAEKIINGAISNTQKDFGFELEREKGEKHADYLKRYSNHVLSESKKALEQKQLELDEKLKNFKGGDEYKSQIEQLTNDLDSYKMQVAELEPLKGIDEKYNQAQEELSGLKLSVAFGNVKPNFPETVNKYEADAKWQIFKNKVLENHTLEIVEGKAIAIDKENKHKQTPLEDLVAKDESITELMKGRQQNGTGAKPVDLEDVDGVPFKIPKDVSREDLSAMIRKHIIDTEKISAIDSKFSPRFQEIYSKATKVA